VTVLSAFPTSADSSPRQRVLHDVDWRASRIRRFRNHAEDWVAAAPDSLERVLRELAPDMVHTSNLPGIGSGIWERARRLHMPVVHTLHDYHLLCPRTSLTRRDGSPCRPNPLLCGLRTRRLARWGPGVDAVIGVSAYVLERHRDFFPASTVRHVIHHPLTPFNPEFASAPGQALSTVGYLGTLSTVKGVPLVLEIAPRLAERGIRVRVAGDGPLRDAVSESAHLEYLGPLLGSARDRFVASCDAGIVPSQWEEPGLTFVGCEWLSAGRPVISSGRGALAELEALGGVRRATTTAAGVLAAVDELRDAARWAELVGRVPRVDGDADVQRWLDRHLSVYGRAVATASAAA
jgi:glycogen synthase